MKITSIRKLAAIQGINSVGLDKTDLIKAIQRAEGNFDCFGSNTVGYCDQPSCTWREDCLHNGASAGAR